MPDKRLNVFFGYFGSKWLLAPRYPPPEHGTIVEPFAGSACYSLLYPNRRVVLAERDPIVAGVWRYLISVSEQEIMALPLLDHEQSVDEFKLPQEAKWLIGFWLQRASTPSVRATGWAKTRIQNGTTSGAYWDASIRARVARQLKWIRHWQLHEGNYWDLSLDKAATWFIDPPYEVAGKTYVHDFHNFAHLQHWSMTRKGLVIVCENEGAKWLPFKPFAVARSNQGGAMTNREVVYVQRSA
jgi:hypothetical protein